MSFVFKPQSLLYIALAGWLNREQQAVIQYLKTENQVLREVVGKKRILLTDNQRRRMAVKGKVLGRKRLKELVTLFSPDVILRWHRKLVARKYDSSCKRKVAGRPRIRQVIVDCILKMAKENPGWGYVRIQGALANLGYKICQSTVANVLKEHGMEPAPDRRQFTKWSTFLKAHWSVLAAIDFTTVEVWTTRGLLTFYLLFVIDLKSRKVHLAGCTVNPNGNWIKQMARNLTDCDEDVLREHEFLIMDRDTKFTQEFRSTLESADVKPIVLPPYSPNLNAYMERFFRSLK